MLFNLDYMGDKHASKEEPSANHVFDSNRFQLFGIRMAGCSNSRVLLRPENTICAGIFDIYERTTERMHNKHIDRMRTWIFKSISAEIRIDVYKGDISSYGFDHCYTFSIR